MPGLESRSAEVQLDKSGLELIKFIDFHKLK